jgi:ribosomal protein S18 acetylase RimI-like enzyme
MSVHIRPAVVADYTRAGEICVEAYRADGQLPPPGVLGVEDDYAVTLADVGDRARTGEVLVAVLDDALVGCVTLLRPGSEYAEIAEPGEAEFRMLAVAPAAQGRGVGAALVAACLDRAAEQGYTAVAICTRDTNEVAQRMYARFGFTREPKRDWSPRPDIDLVAMRLDLPRDQPSGE